MSLQTQVGELKNQIKTLTEVEYGDFKRKVGQYINSFERQSEGQIPSDLKQKLNTIKDYAIYRPDGNIESTRAKILKDLE
ncbi:MAG: hypothetical protein MK008_07630 [Bdellovibrionales bacterium]|nr:hypothetical protein [Bdellovibrionales bacterium]